jgi:hypothetical protein
MPLNRAQTVAGCGANRSSHICCCLSLGLTPVVPGVIHSPFLATVSERWICCRQELAGQAAYLLMKGRQRGGGKRRDSNDHMFICANC